VWSRRGLRSRRRPRIVMLLCGEENLREVVLFPMNQRAVASYKNNCASCISGW
jgi:aspartyl-tRNA synthetase